MPRWDKMRCIWKNGRLNEILRLRCALQRRASFAQNDKCAIRILNKGLGGRENEIATP